MHNRLFVLVIVRMTVVGRLFKFQSHQFVQQQIGLSVCLYLFVLLFGRLPLLHSLSKHLVHRCIHLLDLLVCLSASDMFLFMFLSVHQSTPVRPPVYHLAVHLSTPSVHQSHPFLPSVYPFCPSLLPCVHQSTPFCPSVYSFPSINLHPSVHPLIPVASTFSALSNYVCL